jgi:hypothetical protein
MQAPGLFDTPDKRGKYGLVHNIGLGGAVVVSLLRRPEFYKPGGPDGRTRCRRCSKYLLGQTHDLLGFLAGWDTIMPTNVDLFQWRTLIKLSQGIFRPIFCSMRSFESSLFGICILMILSCKAVVSDESTSLLRS